ncbi:putative cyclin-D6-1 [Sesamum indicum]|uniref:Cyclin-D6-1 n=1 Tax=Sesamum indicum TaxID=4182 RepID=A0A6I9UJ17_SESIN|nr:putative cyclin-D6-1 [Sesamum indicum]
MEFDLENPLPPSMEKFPSLFHIEDEHMPSKTYLQALNSADSNLSIRREIVSSIFCFSRGFDAFTSYLATNYMDRFLSTHSIPDGKPWILKVVAISCISLALKMRKTEFSVSDLLNAGGFMIDFLTIERMEMLILGSLKWRMRSVNPFSFANYFVTFFKFKDDSSIQALKTRAFEIIFKAQNDVKLLEFKPSVISASALLVAAHELFPVQLPSFRDAICSCSYVNKENLVQCYDLMQEVAMERYGSVLGMVSSSCTPANVLDLHCFSSSISSSQTNQTSETASNAAGIGGLKRPKLQDFATDNSFQLSQNHQ